MHLDFGHFYGGAFRCTHAPYKIRNLFAAQCLQAECSNAVLAVEIRALEDHNVAVVARGSNVVALASNETTRFHVILIEGL
jgi:hypothetical protein